MNELDISFNEITKSNIAKLTDKHSLIAERRICELSEYASCAAEFISSMFYNDYGIYEAFSVLSNEISIDNFQIHNGHLEENRQMLKSFVKLISSHDKAVFAMLLVRGLKERGREISENDFLDTENSFEIISLVKNTLSNEAYDVFSQDFSNPTLKYAKDMREAVSLLINGDVGYCILPIEEKGASRLSTVAEIIFKEDLKINSITPVFGMLGGADMKYALLGKQFNVPEVREGDDRYLEIRIKHNSEFKLAELICVAESMNIQIYRINSFNFNTEDGQLPYISLVFKTVSSDFTELLAYLTLFVSDYTSVGIYRNLE